jgi:hypothetical protein
VRELLSRYLLSRGRSRAGQWNSSKPDLHWTYIGGIERGERNVSLLNIVKIARALNTSPSRLLADVR